MPAFTGQFGIPGKRTGGATAWGGGGDKPAPGSNPLPTTGSAPAGQVYGDGQTFGGDDSHPKTMGGFGGGSGSQDSQPSGGYSMPPQQSGHWDMGQQGAEGAWSNGYNPHWETDSPQRPTSSASTVYQQDQASPPAATPTPGTISNNVLRGADGTPLVDYTPNPRGQGGFGDARDNPNNTMSTFYDPSARQGDRTGYYSDYDNPALRANQNGQKVSLEQAGIKPGSSGDPTWDPQAIYHDPSSPFYIPPGDPRWNQ